MTVRELIDKLLDYKQEQEICFDLVDLWDMNNKNAGFPSLDNIEECNDMPGESFILLKSNEIVKDTREFTNEEIENM